MKALRETFPSIDFDNRSRISSSISSAAAAGLIASETTSTASSNIAGISATSKSVQLEEEYAQHIIRTSAYQNSESQILSAFLARLVQNESSTSSNNQSDLGDGGHADGGGTVSTAIESDDCIKTSSDEDKRRIIHNIADSSSDEDMRRILDSIADSSDEDKRRILDKLLTTFPGLVAHLQSLRKD